MTERAEITLEIGGEDFDFEIDVAHVTKYINGLTQANKIAPSHNLLMNTVKQDQKAKLKPLLAHPSTTLEIAGALVEEFQPKVEVTVKKRSSTLSA
ncbi:putative phage tail assembly chaperone [Pseudomonas sp. MH2]|uniref:Phage tail assembly chaperone n=1 Tax=Pseudomonas machongensis TaxID=3110229 RepID=A0ABU5VBX1_9PSED|nr:putative phage tail assembly chaperone [Pseudomonas sp. MH2]MEA5670752.1 putative phage tail assembly chaperone [Pseudomonas sp. MH2]